MTHKIYVEKRTRVINEFLNNVFIEYRKDKEMINLAVDLTCVLETAECNDSNLNFLNGILGFMTYAGLDTKITRAKALATIIHDLIEFRDNRREKWFCPRSSGYSKFISN